VGGTGKTPLAQYLIQQFLGKGFRVAYISRGYGRKTTGLKIAHNNVSVKDFGDEAALMTRYFPECLVIVSENRRTAIRKAFEICGPKCVVVLDDAFQQLRIKVCFSIVLISGRDLTIPRMIIPAGRLREPLSSVRRADFVILTKLKNSSIQSLPSALEGLYICQGDVNITGFRIGFTQRKYQPNGTENFFVFCGIGDAAHFLNTVQKFGSVVRKRIFADHHWYSDSDLRELLTDFELIPEEKKYMVTTAKDFIRIEELAESKQIFSEITLLIAEAEFVFKNKAQEEFFISSIYDRCRIKEIFK